MSQLRLEARQGNRHDVLQRPKTPTVPSFSTLPSLIKYLLLESFNAPPQKSCFSSKIAVSGEPFDWSRHSVCRFRGGDSDSISHWLCSISHKYLQGQPKVSGCHIVPDCYPQNAGFLSFSTERSGQDDVSSFPVPILILEHGSLHILDATTRGFER